MAQFLRWLSFAISSLLLLQCTNNKDLNRVDDAGFNVDKVSWEKIKLDDIDALNKDLVSNKLTLDVGIYFPSNFDSAFNKVTLDKLISSFKAAKEIYEPAGIQINLLWIKEGKVDPSYFAIQANKLPSVPSTEYNNLYQNLERNPAELTSKALNAFNSIVEKDSDNHRTVYLIALQDVFYPFLEVSEGRNWMIKTVRTGGLSFPPYTYHSNIPDHLRGVITISNLSREDRLRGTIAHEIGHKVINVSHEYKDTNPGHEVYQDGGLMLYGDGEDIPSGKEGRWHLERLKLSPFLYVLDENGGKSWNPEFKDGGHYYDPIYGDKVIYFEGNPPIDSDW